MKDGIIEGVWYPVEAPGYICANGKPYHGSMRMGYQNNLLLFLDGGGLSWCTHSAARPIGEEGVSAEGYYVNELGPVSVMHDRSGLTRADPWNLFKDWNVFVVHYATGDIHIGSSEFPYTSLQQEQKVLHHCGYRNFRLVLAAAKAHCPNPERILIAGVSAGALAVAALAEDIIQEFPQCSAISCCVDGGLTYTNWNRIAMDVWNAPTSITEKMTGPDMVLDCLIALNRKYGKQVQCLYISSTRDAVLAWFQKALDGEVPEYTADAGIRYQKNLTNTCLKLIEEVPEAGVYIYANPCRDVDLDPALGLTQHTILLAENIIESGENRPSVMQWLWDCVHGRTSKVGLELLG